MTPGPQLAIQDPVRKLQTVVPEAASAARAYIGISGWRYPPWRGVFYPKGLRQASELHFASRSFSTIEINGSFYSLMRPETYDAWYEQTPEGFSFAVKGGRYITHLKRLKDVAAPLANFFASGLLRLREKLGPILWQLPPQQVFDEAKLRAFSSFCRAPRDKRHGSHSSTTSAWPGALKLAR